MQMHFGRSRVQKSCCHSITNRAHPSSGRSHLSEVQKYLPRSFVFINERVAGRRNVPPLRELAALKKEAEMKADSMAFANRGSLAAALPRDAREDDRRILEASARYRAR